MKLLIVIPALNEQDSIESIIQRSLDARAAIVANSPVSSVAITVVSDGSTDRTVELAQRYLDSITLIIFEKNRGYGAAIKEAWSRSNADILGFLDADGTCDPGFFASLCTVMEREAADVVLGCRLNPDSRMPLVRRIGNMIFASMLTLFSSTRVRDSASGMRIVRRASLPKLMPLPDGLHFTPAMSARAVLSTDLTIVEIDMPYRDREGESKLKVGKDGVRFLSVILQSAFLYRPFRPMALMGAVSIALGGGLMFSPTLFYLRNGVLEEWMIYRFVVSHLLGVAGCLLVCAAYLSSKIVAIAFPDQEPDGSRLLVPLRGLFSARWFWLAPVFMAVLGASLVFRSFSELLVTGATYEHWSRFIAMSFLLLCAIVLAVTRIVDFVLGLVSAQVEYMRGKS